MTGAYAGILNGGSSVTPYGLNELTLKGETDSLMGAGGGIGERVISQQAAGLLTYMMSKVVSEGTGTRARLADRPAAGKTGTTSAARDAWFIGFTADYVAGVWLGYDDNQPLKGVTGGGLPADIWHEVMTRIEDGVPVSNLPEVLPENATASAGFGAQNATAQGDQPGGWVTQELEPSQPLMNPSDDQVEALLRDILKNKQ